MIAAGLDWGSDSRFDLPRVALSLGLLADGQADCEQISGTVLAQLAFPASRLSRNWHASRTPEGRPVLLCGWIDNAAQLAEKLGLPIEASHAAIYGAAISAWGDEAERRIIGDYATVLISGPGTMRLARAPWSNATLFWASQGTVTLAASIPRPIFAAGFPKRPDPDLYAEAICRLSALDGDRHFFQGLHRVPQGAIVTVDHGRAATNRWYDPHTLSPTCLGDDDAYVDAARELLADAVGAALKPARRPGILLSGGLDSPLIAAEMLGQMPPDARLQSFTFEPMARADRSEVPGHFENDRPFVEAFARMHPRIEPHFVDNAGVAFGHRMQDFFLAADAAYPSFSSTDFHGPWQAASDAGCDWLFTGDFGNQTFSNDGRWAFVEFLNRGKWLELLRLLRDTPGDDRTMVRKLAARSILPNLPATIRKALRTLVHGEGPRSLVRDEIAQRLNLQERQEKVYGSREWYRSRRAFTEHAWQVSSGGGEIAYAVQQLFGIRTRPVPRYRPLIEFCMTIPTEQYVRGGQMRWLARRMGVGVIPEAQRLNARYGLHGADWHIRNTPLLAEMRLELERIEDDPVMAKIIDVERAIDLLDRWPETPSHEARMEIFVPVTAAIIAGRFARYVDGRN